MTFKLRDGLSIGDQTVINSEAEITAQDLFYDGALPSVLPRISLNLTRPSSFPKGTERTDENSIYYYRRNSSAYYMDSDGILKLKQAYEERFEHDPLTGECLGVLLEKEARNYLTYTLDFKNAYWTKTVNIDSNYQTAPDATLTANAIKSTGDNSYLVAIADSAANTADMLIKNNWVMGSLYVKPVTATKVKLTIANSLIVVNQGDAAGDHGTAVTFSLVGDGSILEIQSVTDQGRPQPYVPLTEDRRTYIQKLENGWYRINVPLTSYNGEHIISSTYYKISLPDSVVDDELYIWGPQLESEPYATSYMPTSGATVVRDSDAFYLNKNFIDTIYDKSKGTFFLEAIPYDTKTSDNRTGYFCVASTISSMYILFPYCTNANIYTGGLYIASNFGRTLTTAWEAEEGSQHIPFVTHKAACAFDDNNISVGYALNGNLYGTDGGTQQFDTWIGTPKNIIGVFFGRDPNLDSSTVILRAFKYYDVKLSDEEIVGLTTR